jgi:benzoate-CoA ligase family protein
MLEAAMRVIDIPERFNAAAWVVDRHLEQGRGDRIAILHGDDAISYGDLAAAINRTGHALRDLGVQVEQRVLMLVLDCPEFAYTFFGAMKIGAVPVPVNTMLKSQDYAYLLEDSRARVLVVSAELLPAIEPVLAGAPWLQHVLVIGGGGSNDFERCIATQSPELDAAPTSRDDVAFWLYTSGTTGRSRGAVHLHHDMVYCSELYASGILNMSAQDRTFSIAKLFFAYGLGNALYCPLAAGATTVLFPGRPQPDAIFGVIDRYRPTLFFGVPTAYAAMLHAAERGAQVDFSSVRYGVSAGEALPASVFTRWRDRFGFEILDGIGSTEILHIFLSNRPGDIRPGSSGKPVPGYDIKVLDDDDRPVAVGEVGNLWVAGDSTCAYYWNKHDASKRAFHGEWMRTGDKYRIDEDGYFWYAGRADDMLKVGGIWVSPTEVEATIVEHPDVLECAVVGASDADTLVKPKAYVVLKDGANAGEAMAVAIQMFVKDRIAPYKYPRWIEFVDELPKTATGKIQRFRLRG